MISVFSCCQQRKRVDSQKWVSTEEDVTEGDLGLGKIARLDICTGMAVCSTAGDKASGSNMDTQEGAEDNSEWHAFHFFTHFNACAHLAHISDCKMHHVTTESSDEDHLTMEDLISYSFQVAKGMEFLSSRKVKLQLIADLALER